MSRTHIAILGAGPTGLEAALAAVEAGLDFTIFEMAGGPAGNVRSWEHVRLFTPWSMNASARARAQLAAAGLSVPDNDDCPTGLELVRDLLEPIAGLADIGPRIRYGTRVLEIARDGLLKSDEIGTDARGDAPFRILVEQGNGRAGEERVVFADVVLDCTGTYHKANALGRSGIRAPGERSVADSIVRFLPDITADAADWAGQRILLVGEGHSGQTAAQELATLCSRHPDTAVTWAIRNEHPTFKAVEDDPLPQRAALAARARAILSAGTGVTHQVSGIAVRLGRSVEGLRRSVDGIEVTLRAAPGALETLVVDRIIALTGSVGDHMLYRQLQVHECWATSGPMKLAAALLASSSVDCLTQTSHGSDTLRNPEPGFFILGEKSYGRNSTYLMRIGWAQVDEVFPLLAVTPALAGESP